MIQKMNPANSVTVLAHPSINTTEATFHDHRRHHRPRKKIIKIAIEMINRNSIKVHHPRITVSVRKAIPLKQAQLPVIVRKSTVALIHHRRAIVNGTSIVHHRKKMIIRFTRKSQRPVNVHAPKIQMMDRRIYNLAPKTYSIVQKIRQPINHHQITNRPENVQMKPNQLHHTVLIHWQKL